MATIVDPRGRITLPKWIRHRFQLSPGSEVDFAVNEAGDVVLQRARPASRRHPPTFDRFEAARGSADTHWRTDELMRLLRAHD